jgi:hypothetical protein
MPRSRKSAIESDPARLLRPPPGKIALDRCFILGLAALFVGIVEAQDEAAAVAAHVEPVEEGCADIADMQQARGTRRESDDGASDYVARHGCDLWLRRIGGSSALR